MNAPSVLVMAVCLFGTSAAFAQGLDASTASCALPRTIDEPCRIEWAFPDSSPKSYWVQQFEPFSATWRSLSPDPDGTTSQGMRETPVEAAYLYRVLACDDALATINCTRSTIVWAPFIQPREQVHLIPSAVPTIGPRLGRPYVGGIFKNADWLVQVIQYNILQMVNAISYADVADLPDMTPPTDLRVTPSSDPVDQIQFNVYAFYLAEQGKPLDMPEAKERPRPPHEHPKRNPE